jgi:hypothetical protein
VPYMKIMHLNEIYPRVLSDQTKGVFQKRAPYKDPESESATIQNTNIV